MSSADLKGSRIGSSGRVPTADLLRSIQAVVVSGALWMLAPAAQSAEEWVRHFNGTANGDDAAVAVGTDASGNAFVTGSSAGSGSGPDFATIKYSPAGVALWTNRYNGPANLDDRPTALGVDPNGDVVVAGSSVSSNGFYDYAIVKYSNEGVLLWTNRYNGPGNSDDTVSGLAINSTGTVFVTGTSAATGVPPFNYPTNRDYATIAYSSNGIPLWTNRFNSVSNFDDYATAIAVDTNGNVLVTGYSASSPTNFDVVTLKYSGAGMSLWTNHYRGPLNGDDLPKAITADHSGNVFVTVRAAAPGHLYDYATVKYSSNGLPLWTNVYNGPGNGVDEPNGIAVDHDGNAFVTGYSVGADSSWDFATIKYSSNGVPAWTNRYLGMANGSDVATALVVDGEGNVVVTGFSDGNGTSYDIATVAYSNNGVPLSTNRYASAGNNSDQANAVAVDRSGYVFVAGISATATSGVDFTVIKYPPVSVPLLKIQRIAGKVVLSWSNPAFALQAAGRVDGTYTNVSGAMSPFTNTTPAAQLFFRLISPN